MMRVTAISLAIAFCLSIGHANAQNISDEAMHHFDRGQAAVEMAKSPTDYEDAIKEFEKAATLAPDWPDVYYNLGLIQEKLRKYDDAIKNLTKYLEFSLTQVTLER
jgi:tetratricopeptide (TPR) repeat protein